MGMGSVSIGWRENDDRENWMALLTICLVVGSRWEFLVGWREKRMDRQSNVRGL